LRPPAGAFREPLTDGAAAPLAGSPLQFGLIEGKVLLDIGGGWGYGSGLPNFGTLTFG
jgi:hypothetical protein